MVLVLGKNHWDLGDSSTSTSRSTSTAVLSTRNPDSLPAKLPEDPKALKPVQRRYDCCDRSACRIDKINKRLNESNRYRVVLSAIFMRSTISSICAYVMQMTEIASITRNFVGSFKQMFSRMKS